MKWLGGCAIVALAALITACGGSPKPKPSPAPAVQTSVARSGDVHPTLQIAGVVAPYRQIGVASDLSEPIGEVDVQEGDRVRAGQVLARLLTDDLDAQLASAQRTVSEDVARYAQTSYQSNATSAQDSATVRAAQTSLRQAQVNLSGALTDLKRYENLAANGYVSSQLLDQQRTTVADDQQAVTAARSQLASAITNAQADGNGANAGAQREQIEAAREAAQAAQAAELQLQREIARATIVAPVDGVVDAVNANPGEYPSGRQLFTIEQTGNVYAVLPASSEQVLSIRKGAPAAVIAGDPRKDEGTVAAVLDQVQPGTTNFTVKVLLNNQDDHLHAGMPVTATVSLPPSRGVLVPITAFVDDTHQAVYVVRNGVVYNTPVQEIASDNSNAVVSGVSPGAAVVSNVEDANVGNGDRVRTSARSRKGKKQN